MKKQMFYQDVQDFAKAYVEAEIAAYNNFCEVLIEMYGITSEQADKVFTEYKKAKVIKINRIQQMYNVTHGIYLDKEVVMNAINL